MTTLIATVTDNDRELWMVTLVIGFVVLLAVIVLLTLLVHLVHAIDTGAVSLWAIIKRLAQNTTGLYQLAGTASILRALREEALRQDKLLSRADRS